MGLATGMLLASVAIGGSNPTPGRSEGGSVVHRFGSMYNGGSPMQSTVMGTDNCFFDGDTSNYDPGYDTLSLLGLQWPGLSVVGSYDSTNSTFYIASLNLVSGDGGPPTCNTISITALQNGGNNGTNGFPFFGMFSIPL